ncbi:MAG: carbon-nitrogen hydrolase family protein, partial [Candidatus Promineifilaceae bacterium]|nr:carbon-nitrogen hydrolase family protein [Candidatus Promineifilaceae bacterium]
HAGVQPARAKVYLPDEPGYWEASWYDRGERRFPPTPLTLDDGTSVQAGFLICTELWFMQHARDYGQAGVHLLLTPRATEARTVEKWLVGGRAAAIISGAYSLSSNKRGGVADAGGAASAFGGQGWAIDPDGEVLALTSAEEPFVTVEVDLARAEAAKERYPRYVEG